MNLDIYKTDEESDEADKEATIKSTNESDHANKRHAISEELKIKFEKLKSERLKLVKKHERNRHSRRRRAKSPDKGQPTQQDNPLIQNNAHSIDEKVNVYLDPDDHEQLLIQTYEKHINSAIKSSDVERAEKLSDELSKHESEINSAKIAKAGQFRIRPQTTNKRAGREPLFWRFEAKKKWETKSNM